MNRKIGFNTKGTKKREGRGKRYLPRSRGTAPRDRQAQRVTKKRTRRKDKTEGKEEDLTQSRGTAPRDRRTRWEEHEGS